MKQPKYKLGDIICGVGGNAIMGEIVSTSIITTKTDTNIFYKVLANDNYKDILEENALLLVFDVDVAWNNVFPGEKKVGGNE